MKIHNQNNVCSMIYNMYSTWGAPLLGTEIIMDILTEFFLNENIYDTTTSSLNIILLSLNI